MSETGHTSLIIPSAASPLNPPPTSQPPPTPQPLPHSTGGLDPFHDVDSPMTDSQEAGEHTNDLRATKRRRANTDEGDDGDSTRSVSTPQEATLPSFPLTPTRLPNPPNAVSSLSLNLNNMPPSHNSVSRRSTTHHQSDSPHPTTPRDNNRRNQPENGTPDVNVSGFIGDNPLTGMDIEMKTEWNLMQAPKALAYPHDASYSHELKTQVAAQIEDTIAEFLTTERPVVTAPAGPKPTATAKSVVNTNRRPWCYLVSRISDTAIDRICAEKFISNKYGTIHVLPFDPPPSNYIGRIRHLTYEASRQKDVEDIVKDCIRQDPRVRDFMSEFITTHNDRIPPTVPNRSLILDWLIDTSRVYHIQDGGTPGKAHTQWKWYIFTPTADQEHVNTWTQNLTRLSIKAGIYGHGEVLTNHKCTRCKSTNHTAGECPFSKHSQFVPPPPTPRASTNNSRGGSRTRGRGGGRGPHRNREE